MSVYSKLKRLAGEATAGPWISGGNWVSTVRGNSVADCARGDEDFIAAANPTTVLALIAENEQLTHVSGCHLLRAQTLEVERDQLRAEVAGLKTGYEAYEQTVKELRAEVEALRKDAERYRWLHHGHSGYIEVVEWIGPHATGMTGEDLDALIDAAMGKGVRS